MKKMIQLKMREFQVMIKLMMTLRKLVRMKKKKRKRKKIKIKGKIKRERQNQILIVMMNRLKKMRILNQLEKRKESLKETETNFFVFLKNCE